ncbi:MAG: Asp-tRNA(Asn)/Glu-tRNA(Gln) amidotransferase subunit GatC [Actinomycetaceae bacterium]|nr:Asp-tRNA(Asn)/Glu-tRNA(Gln) amidotransferase subunit GatC [Actinomycetaceae bacterium]
MSRISKEEVTRLAGLARIALTEEEVERFAQELDVIAQAVATVGEIVAEDTPATSHPIALENVMRADVVGETLNRDELLDAAPDAEAGMFRVPQILGEEQ